MGPMTVTAAAAAAGAALIAVPAVAYAGPTDLLLPPVSWNAQEHQGHRSLTVAPEPEQRNINRREHEGHRRAPVALGVACASLEARQADDAAAAAYLVGRGWEPSRATATLRKLSGDSHVCR